MAGYRQFLASGKIAKLFHIFYHSMCCRCAENLSWELFVFICDKHPLSNIDRLPNNVLDNMIFGTFIVSSWWAVFTSKSDEVDMPDNTQQHTLQLSLGLNLWNFLVPGIIHAFSNRKNSRRSRPAMGWTKF